MNPIITVEDLRLPSNWEFVGWYSEIVGKRSCGCNLPNEAGFKIPRTKLIFGVTSDRLAVIHSININGCPVKLDKMVGSITCPNGGEHQFWTFTVEVDSNDQA